MISPDKVQSEAKKRENENYRFRTYLKGYADDFDSNATSFVEDKTSKNV